MYAERATVAQLSHQPLDVRLIEWNERMHLMGGEKGLDFHRYIGRAEFNNNIVKLSYYDLLAIKERFGATHYISSVKREELESYRVFSSSKYHVYRIADLYW